MKIITCILIALSISSCGKAKASSAHAEVIPSNDGTTCYGIFDDQGELKGGNCK